VRQGYRPGLMNDLISRSGTPDLLCAEAEQGNTENPNSCYVVIFQGPSHESLARAYRSRLGRLITRRERPEAFQQALSRNSADIRVVIQFSEV
jgi:hypothetical protein